MKHAGVTATAFALLMAQNLAAAELAPGKAAGIQKAQTADTNLPLYLLGGGLVIAGIALVASGDSDHVTSQPPATSTTPTTSTSTST
ncbi:MAG TPA: hypothetical protein VG798_00990 [Rhizomicrobium sp.]|nr:hypothetical protein [Rhizomicrobium sp.]